jgi:hypothetical protein
MKKHLMDKTFDSCVDLLQGIAKRAGLSYKQINVLIFCLGWPIFTLWLARKAFRNNHS